MTTPRLDIPVSKCVSCNRNAIRRSYALGRCWICYAERDMTPDQRAEREEARRRQRFQRAANSRERLPYTATVTERTTVIVYRTIGRRCGHDDEQCFFTDTQQVLDPGAVFYYGEVRDGLYHAELSDGGRFLIGADFVTVTMRRTKQQQQQHDDDQGDDNHNTQHDEGGDDGSIAGLDDRTGGKNYPVRTTAETTGSDIVRTD